MITIQWTDSDSVTQTLSGNINALNRKVTAEQEEVPVRKKLPYYIPMGFNGPNLSVTLGFQKALYPNVATLNTDLIITVTAGDDTLYPEMPINSQWYVNELTISRDQGQQTSHKCELKLVKVWA